MVQNIEIITLHFNKAILWQAIAVDSTLPFLRRYYLLECIRVLVGAYPQHFSKIENSRKVTGEGTLSCYHSCVFQGGSLSVHPSLKVSTPLSSSERQHYDGA